MALYGSSIPLDDGSFVVTTICPNAFSHQRLMQALNNIVPEAGDPPPPPPKTICSNTNATLRDLAEDLQRRLDEAEREDDTGEEYTIPGCATGSCGVD